MSGNFFRMFYLIVSPKGRNDKQRIEGCIQCILYITYKIIFSPQYMQHKKVFLKKKTLSLQLKIVDYRLRQVHS